MKTIDRTYQVRGKQVRLQELADVAAVRSTGGPRTAALDALGDQTSLPQVRAFEDAGWSFVPRQQAEKGARVYLKPGGRVAVGTNRLTVRVSESYSEEQAQALLTGYGYTIVERLKLASNLFIVAVPEGHDAIEAAQQLSAPDAVEFAEPELIEMIKGR